MEQELNQEKAIVRRKVSDAEKDFARTVHHRGYHDVVVKKFGAFDEARQDQYFEQNWTEDQIEIIECDGVPCGWLAVEDHGDYLELGEIILLPEFQGQGLGTRIIEDIIQTAKARNIPLRLRVMFENEAIDLYRRLGFKETGKTPTHFEMELKPNEA
jgi:GNAT superfamily N-acetyltransferase